MKCLPYPNIQSWVHKGWVWLFPMARNRQNKLSERAKKTWQQKSAALGLKMARKKEEKNISAEAKCVLAPLSRHATQRNRSWLQQPPGRQLLMLTHIYVITFPFMTLCLNSMFWIIIIIVKRKKEKDQ